MSTDLRQFFTTDYVPTKLCENSVEKFLINVLSYTPKKNIDAFQRDIENENLQIEDFGMMDMEYVRSHLFPDYIGMDAEKAILSPFFDEEDLEINGVDTPMDCVYDQQNQAFVSEAPNFIPQLREQFNMTFLEAQEWCKIDENKDGYDQYLLETVQMTFYYIQFKNKSKARKFRKLYKKNYEIRALLEMFGYVFFNGQFMYGSVKCIDDFYDDYGFPIAVANDALKIMSNSSGKKPHDTTIIQEALEEQLDELNPCTLMDYLINSLNSSLKTNSEVIM